MPNKLRTLDVIEGVEPSVDRPQTSTPHFTFSKRIRFKDGFPEKVGGWVALTFSGDVSFAGAIRTIYPYKLTNFVRRLYGTSSNLYYVIASQLNNVTPVRTTTIAAADSLDTYYDTLGSDPIATVSGSNTITVTDTAHKLVAGDTIELSGASAVNGIPAGDINSTQFIRSTTANSYTIIVSTNATSTGSGGGGSVVRATDIITMNVSAHGLNESDRIKITGAADTGGILAADINAEHIIRNVSTNAFDISTGAIATSSVTGGGGSGVEYQEPIPAGLVNASVGSGYGLGLYGVGLYGVAKTSVTVLPPQIWSHDRFGDLVVCCRGNGNEVYSWDSNTDEAPAPIANAPDEVNYVFVSDSIVVCLGYDGATSNQVDNAITWSDQAQITNWSTGQSGSDVIEGAGRFISHVAVRGENLLFTDNQTYLFRYIGGQLIWQTRLLDGGIGIIAQNARVSASGIAYWMAEDNFYMYRGGNVEVIPSNTSTECTCLNYVFKDLNYGQRAKIHCYYNDEFREVAWHYPSETSNEPDRIVRVNIDTYAWAIDELDRSASEYPASIEPQPQLSSVNGPVYLHEVGVNDDGAGMEWQLDTGYLFGGTNTVQHAAFMPDVNFTGTFTTNLKTKDYPLSADKHNVDYTVSNSTDRIATELNGRFWKYSISGNALDQEFLSGRWYEELKKSSAK